MKEVLKNLKSEFINDLGDWSLPLNKYLQSEEFDEILNFLIKEVQSKKIIVPQKKDLFNAFKYCQYSNVKVVILGQGPNPQIIDDIPVDHGFAFSSNNKKFMPKSLENIFLEIEKTVYGGFDLEFLSRDINLTSWAKQGVLLLNTSLTTRKDVIGAHSKVWDSFIQEVFKVLRERHTGLIYCLWGNHAKSYKKYINEKNNYVLESGQPSLLSAIKGNWFGNNHFVELNNIIEKNNGKNFKINWKK